MAGFDMMVEDHAASCPPGARRHRRWSSGRREDWGRERGPIVARWEGRGEGCWSVRGGSPCGTGNPRSIAPSDPDIALAMAMVAVLGSWDVEGMLLEGLEINLMISSKGLQDGIEPLPRPPQQLA